MCVPKAPLTLTYILRSIFITRRRSLPSRLFVVCAVLKVALGFSPRQIQYLSLPTREAYQKWIQQQKVEAEKLGHHQHVTRLVHDREVLEDGKSSLLWIGDRKQAKKIVLFFHGGGYAAPITTGHLDWCWRSYVLAGIEKGVEVAVAVLEYTLIPEARYPVQLRQAASGLAHLLRNGIPPQDILIGGDSAGGQLTAQLVCHLLQPQPTVPEITLAKPLAGAFLVSPWVAQSTDDASYKENAWIDMLPIPGIIAFTKELLGPGANPAISAFPLDRDESSLIRMSSVLSQMYMTAGAHEIFRDQVLTFKERVELLNPDLKLRFQCYENCAHDFIVIENEDGECTQDMKQWMVDLLAVE
ncbi:triacylglycerol lipase 2 [Fusarium pseudocircinatum]|uniref:Triacylglycerol lipase 2 n=1 Tax=Fusarium pseudocircinatum TaxID=56676 RepID=A0A8H5KGC9_9HYPO|nr:triacylglycerol lipase 2 [Fusarium pseudocircinatum]